MADTAAISRLHYWCSHQPTSDLLTAYNQAVYLLRFRQDHLRLPDAKYHQFLDELVRDFNEKLDEVRSQPTT